jgi:hypothetical protein
VPSLARSCFLIIASVWSRPSFFLVTVIT